MIKVAEFKLNRFNSFLINVFSLTAFILGLVLLLELTGKGLWINFMSEITYNNALIVFITLFSVIALHELFHGLAYKLYGARLKFGIKFLNIYTMDISGTLYTASQMAVIMLLPLIALTGILTSAIFLLPKFSCFIVLGVLFNISGSAGDILLLSYILYRGRNCRIKDERLGFSIYTV
ncbi:MAG: DUF3267 domain-containing protein [Bacillota bacterium]